MHFLWVSIFLAIVSLVALLETQGFSIHCLQELHSIYVSLIVLASSLVTFLAPMYIFVPLGNVLLWTVALKIPNSSNHASMALS